MRKLYLIVFTLFCSSNIFAQPWLEGVQKDANGRIKLQDIINTYEQRNPRDDAKHNETNEFEGKDHLYQRWLWNWQRHTNEDGYLISPLKQWNALKALESQRAEHRANAKGTMSPDANWTFQGPTNPLGGNKGIGRINWIEFHPTDTNTFIVGAAGGGLWKTTDNGMSWTVMNDYFPVLGISDIDYNPKNPNTIYVCTGDRDANDNYSMGVFKSTDGGTTWNTTGFQYKFTELEKTNCLLVNDVDTNNLILATSKGIYKSYDAGQTWSLKQSGNYRQLLYMPGDTTVVFASGAVNTVQIFRSNDGGESWNVVSSFGNVVRCEMAVTPADPSVVKAITAIPYSPADNRSYGLEGVYSSSDTGKTFTKILDDDSTCDNNILASNPKGNRCGGQGWYDLTIQISPVNKNHIIVGGVNTWFSTNGGSKWKVANQWSNTVTGVTIVHADKHAHRFHPLKPDVLYECNDGGIFYTGSPMSSNAIWNDLSEGLGITQFYRNAVSPSAMYVIGGAQDNGTKMLTGGTSKHMTGADGMDCQIDPADSNIIFTSQQYGELRRSTNGGDNFKDIQNNIPNRPRGAWITPIIISPIKRESIFAGYRQIFYSPDRGDNWYPMSDSFGDNMERLAATPLDPNYLFAASKSILFYTKDFGNKWSSALNINTISDIMTDPHKKSIVWATFRSYTGNKVGYYDVDSGKWKIQSDGLPDVPVNCITYDKQNKTYYIGTDLGVFYREEYKTDWLEFNNGSLPNVEVIDLGINPTTNEIWAATYGRGMWKSATHKSTLGVANLVPYQDGVITIAPNPNKGSFKINTNNMSLKGKLVTLQIMDITGKLVWSNNITISTSGSSSIQASLSKGTYIVQLREAGTIVTKAKMIIY